jgi:hypothetical protein
MHNNLSNEDALLQEHEEFMKQVSESGVPLWVLQYYGEPKPLNNDNNQKNREDTGHDHSSNAPL